MNDTSPIAAANRFAGRKPIVFVFVPLLLGLWLLIVSTRQIEAQSLTRQVQIDLLQAQASVRQFYQSQAKVERYKDRERLQVSGYTTDLFKAPSGNSRSTLPTCISVKSPARSARSSESVGLRRASKGR
jgi:hypothetical protein